MLTPTFSKIAFRWSCTVQGERCRRPAIASVGEALRDELGHGPLAVGEPVGVGDQRRELGRRAGSRITAVGRVVAEHRAAHQQPAPGRRADPRAGDGAVGAPSAMLRARSATVCDHHRRAPRRRPRRARRASARGGVIGQRRSSCRRRAAAGRARGRRRAAGQRGEQDRAPQALGQVPRAATPARAARRGVKWRALGLAQQHDAAPRRRRRRTSAARSSSPNPFGPRSSRWRRLRSSVPPVASLRLAAAPARAGERSRTCCSPARGSRSRCSAASWPCGSPFSITSPGREQRGRVQREHADAVERHGARERSARPRARSRARPGPGARGG